MDASSLRRACPAHSPHCLHAGLYVGALLALLLLGGCGARGPAPLRGMQQEIDLQRFMGPWYVIAHIPIHFPPLASEKDAHNAIESYALEPDGAIATTYTFRQGSFDGPERRMTPRARVANAPLNSEWKMRFFWFLPAGDYLILDLDDAYEHTIVGVPDRSNVWIMARTPNPPAATYAELIDRAVAMGFQRADITRVPQRWE